MRKLSRRGFTLVELSISMVFIGLLSLAVVFVINNTVVAYRRGNTLSRLNTVGMDVVDDIKMAIQGTSAKTLIGMCSEIFEDEGERKKCEDDNAYSFVSIVKYADVTVVKQAGNTTLANLPIYGVFCTGTYSYIWNSGYFESSEAEFNAKTSGTWAKLVYNGGSVTGNDRDPNKPFRLLKVRDDSRSVCIATIYPDYKSEYGSRASTENMKYVKLDSVDSDIFSKNEIDIRNIGDGKLEEEPIYLLASGGDNDLVLYDLLASRPAVSTENDSVFYPISFVLGTIDGGINVLSQGKTCSAPNEYEGNLDYCAINKFSFAARATGGDRSNGQI